MKLLPELEHGVFNYYKDLTVRDVTNFTPLYPEREYKEITLPSKINKMKGTGDEPKRPYAKRANVRLLFKEKFKDY